MSVRKNRYVTDMKYDTKRQIEALKRSCTRISEKWGDTDMFIASQFDDFIEQLNEIKAEVDGVDVKSH